MSEKVKEVQAYLENRGIIVAETTIVDTAIDIVRRNRVGLYAFVWELERKKDAEWDKRKEFVIQKEP